MLKVIRNEPKTILKRDKQSCVTFSRIMIISHGSCFFLFFEFSSLKIGVALRDNKLQFVFWKRDFLEFQKMSRNVLFSSRIVIVALVRTGLYQRFCNLEAYQGLVTSFDRNLPRCCELLIVLPSLPRCCITPR